MRDGSFGLAWAGGGAATVGCRQGAVSPGVMGKAVGWSFPVLRMTVLLLLGLATRGVGAGYLAYCGLADGYWQVHRDRLEGGACERVTGEGSDKRGLRGVSGTLDVMYRDNEGRLFRQEAVVGSKPRAMLAEFEVVKDFDLHPERGLLISSYAPNSTDSIRIWWASAAGKDRRLMVAEGKLNEMPRWGVGGGYYFVRANRGATRIWRGAMDGAGVELVFAEDGASTTDPAPSPDGKRLAYCRDDGAGMDLWVSGADGTGAARLHAGAGLEAEPCWSLDGREIFFASWDGRNFRIARIGVTGVGFAWVSPVGMDCRTPVFVAVNRTTSP